MVRQSNGFFSRNNLRYGFNKMSKKSRCILFYYLIFRDRYMKILRVKKKKFEYMQGMNFSERGKFAGGYLRNEGVKNDILLHCPI